MYSPVKEKTASFTCSSVTSTRCSSKTVPVVSCVSVTFPSSITATYSLFLSVKRSQTFVALPRHTGSTPSASGSSVPVCPIFFVFKIPLSFATTSKDVYPFSLYTLIIPLIINFPVSCTAVIFCNLKISGCLYR